MELRDARSLGEFARAVDTAGLRYVVGGSVAAGYYGEPRATLDVDVLVEAGASDASRLATSLQAEFLVTADAVRDAVEHGSSFNAFNRSAFTKIDVYVAGDGELDRAQLASRRAQPLFEGSETLIWVTSPEILVLRKLDWFRRGRMMSERQWLDVLGILKQQRERLDRRVMDDSARRVGLEYLLRRATDDAGL